MLYNASGSYSITSMIADEAPDADYPMQSEFDEAIDLGLYGFSRSQWVLPDTSKPFAYRLLRRTDAAFWQITDPDRVWQVNRDNAVSNVENPNFIFLAANSLTLGMVFALSAVGATL